MKKTLRTVFFTCMLLALSLLICEHDVRAGLRMSPETPMLLGEWQPSETSQGMGNFLLVESFSPGNRLAVKLFVERPGERIEVKFMIEAVSKPPRYLKTTVQDNGPLDLLPAEEAVILVELGKVPEFAVSRYIVEVRTTAESQPVTKAWQAPLEAEGFLEHFGAALCAQADTLWNLPETIATGIMQATRALYRGEKLVIVSRTGDHLEEISLTEEAGSIETPVWLTETQILLVARQRSAAYLKMIDTGFCDDLQDFGSSPTVGEDPHVLPQSSALVFLQGNQLMIADVQGTHIQTLIHEKAVADILGIFPGEDGKHDNLLFLAQNPELHVLDLWLAQIDGMTLLSLQQVPYDERWKRLAKVQIYQDRMLYEQIDYLNDQSVMNLYCATISTGEIRKITDDASDDRYPAWSLDGTRIVYVSGVRY